MRRFVAAPTWGEEQLEEWRRQAIARFIEERTTEGTARYRQAFARALAQVEELFAATDELRQFGTGAALAANPPLLIMARYLGAPPISADDLSTLAGQRVAVRLELDPALARHAAEVILSAVDSERFPWLFADPPRHPTPEERTTALRWTAGLKAASETTMGRRNESSARQERRVRELLAAHGLSEVPPRRIDMTGGLEPGQFSREALVAGTRCDIPVGLWDGRFLLLECKVSNSAVNSVKRLNREVGGKARHWREAFGQRAVTGAVLAGVYNLANLVEAQTGGVAIFWEHDLEHLGSLVDRTRP